ncbi:MAG TPA: hypothetical protein VJZ71_04290 [Phycisphaerae bacterium]|nr:hypothetical protein [Phycisphaerae bacterium]
MAVTTEQRDKVEAFRVHFETALARDERFAGSHRHDREDGSTLATRWRSSVNEHVWFEIAVRPLIPQVRVGVLTDDRWKSEDFEERIEESGDTMSEFVEMGFHEAGLEWLEPTVEHFREEMKYFYFATAFELRDLNELSDPAVRSKTRQMLEGYDRAFGPFIK